MASEFNRHGITAVHFDGNTPAKERADIIQRFRDGEIKILCNVDLISVGFDCPRLLLLHTAPPDSVNGIIHTSLSVKTRRVSSYNSMC